MVIRTFFLVLIIGSYCVLGGIDLAQGDIRKSLISFLLAGVNGLIFSGSTQ